MQNTKTLGDASVMKNPGKSMSVNGDLTNLKPTIPSTVITSGPIPTRVAFFHVTPKTEFSVLCFAFKKAYLATIFGSAATNLVGFGAIRFFTNMANGVVHAVTNTFMVAGC